MKPDIKARFTDQMLADITERFQPDPGSLETLDGFESFIYRFTCKGEGRILRIGHSGRRGREYVLGEIDWINYLAAGGAGVAEALPSANGILVETLADGHGEQFIAVSFREAQGKPPHQFGWGSKLYENYGRTIGRMHALTSRYEPTVSNGRRPYWHEPAITDLGDVLTRIDPVAAQKMEALVQACHALPAPRDAFGLIHFDAHGGNFFVDEDGRLTMFDFDDCNYNWFAADIAIVLFYKIMWNEDRAAAAREFLHPFLRGYRNEHHLDPKWLETIPIFLKIREIDLYGVIHRDFDLETEDHPWIVGYMKGRREAIHAEKAYVDIDFREFA